MSLPRSLPSVLLLLGAASAAVQWEWEATFDLVAGHYTWSFTKGAAGTYPDSSCKIIILPADSSAKASLEAVEDNAEGQWGPGTSKNPYDELETGNMYTLQLDDDTWTSHFIIHVDSPGAYAVFLEHSPFEFENGFHFLQDEEGKDVEPVHQDHAGHDHGGHDGHDHGGHDGHDHGGEDEISCPWDKNWEWAGVFPVSAGFYDWNAQKVDGAYADKDMKIVVMASEGTLENSDAQARWEAITDAQKVEAGQDLPIGRGSTLHFQQASWASHYRIEVQPGTSHLAIFAQHIPTEFESKYHYLRSATGMDIEPVLEESVLDCKEVKEVKLDRWGEVIIGSFITVLPTLLSLVVIARIFIPMLRTIAEGNLVVNAINSFASGVIFAAAVFLLLPEGLHLVAVGKTEAAASGAWGTSIMSSWFICVLMKHGVHFLASKVGRVVDEDDDEEAAQRANWKVVLPVLFGDFFHNFSDGLVIGVAFKVCGPAFAWKLIGITVLHEAPQEISDFAVMVTKGRMHWGKATLLNFLSGLSTVLGAIITYAAEVDYAAEGAILAFGAGVYLFVALSELGPVVSELGREEGLKESAARLLAFAFGAILIGLVLLDHEHCFAESADGEDAHAGHNHGGSEEAEEDPHAGHNHGH